MGAEAFVAAQIVDFAEATDDRVASLLVAGSGISIAYNDGAGTLTIASTVSASFASLSGSPSDNAALAAALDSKQPLDSNLTAIAALSTTAFGRALLTQADAAATRATIGAGTGTIGGSTGSTDNAVLRADGAGGATAQDSSFVIADLATASPNNTINNASILAIGGTTNVGVSIVPKGSGYFALSVPDGTSTGGNARGLNAVDLNRSRSSANQVASGERSFLAPSGGVASGLQSTAFGSGTASGERSVIFGPGTSNALDSFQAASTANTAASGTRVVRFCGDGGTVNGLDAFAHGNIPGYGSGNNTGQNGVTFAGAWVSAATAFAQGYYARSDRYGMKSWANGNFSGANFGEAQKAVFVARRRTTDATPTVLMLDGSSTRLTINDGEILGFVVNLVGSKSDGTAIAHYLRRGVIKRIGTTTSLVGSIQTIGTDIEDNAATDVAITADDTNEALQIAVTGIAGETWRWVAVVEAVDLAFGT